MTRSVSLADLSRATSQLLLTVQTELAPLELAQLNQPPAPAAWSALECLEHLNRYSRYYNPCLAQALLHADGSPNSGISYSWLGRKFIGMMLPGSTKKAKTLKRMNPGGACLGREVLTEFYQHQEQLLALLARAPHADLKRKAVPIEFVKPLKLRLGETFEFVVVHEQRHVQQALRAKAALGAELVPPAHDGAVAAGVS